MALKTIVTKGHWKDFIQNTEAHQQILALLPPVLQSARWFGGKGREYKELLLDKCLKLEYQGAYFFFFIIEVVYEGNQLEHYLLPLSRSESNGEHPNGILARWEDADGEAFIADATYSTLFHRAMFDYIHRGKKIANNIGTFSFDHGAGLADSEVYEYSHNPAVDQSNSSILYNGRYFMKLYRKLFRETNPEVEMLKFLTEKGNYSHVPAYSGSLIWERKDIPPVTLALMMQKVDARKDNWANTGDELNDFLHAFVHGTFSIQEFVFEKVELLARRTAEMHLALSSNKKIKDFAPESFNDEYRNWMFDHLDKLVKVRLKLIETNKHKLDAEDLRMAQLLKDKKDLVMKLFEQIKSRPLKSLRTRIHGDYHLGQVLFAQDDYVIIDFEGEPESTILERKIKHSPLKDVAGMIRSFHYAVSAKLFFSKETQTMDAAKLHKVTERWFNLIRNTFLNAYMETIGSHNKLFYNKAEINFLIMLHLLEKAIYELGYELNGRPDWVKIPLKGIEDVIIELEKYED